MLNKPLERLKLFLKMKVSDVFKHIKFQTLVGWTVGYIAGIIFNALLGQKFDNKFWLALGGVLIIRIITDLIFAAKDARQ